MVDVSYYLFLHIFCKNKNYYKEGINTSFEWEFCNFTATGSVLDIVDYFRYKKIDYSEIIYMKSLFSDEDVAFNNKINGPVKNGSNCFVVRCPLCHKIHSMSAQNIISKGNIICFNCNNNSKYLNYCGSLKDKIKDIEKYWVYDENEFTPDNIVFNSSDRERTFTVICPSCGKKHKKTKDSIVCNENLLCRTCALSNGHKGVDEGRSLYILYPKVACMFDEGGNNISSKEVYPSSNKPYNFKCQEGHIFKSSPNSMTRFECINSKYKGCPYCSGRKVNSELSFGNCYPNVASLWDYERNEGISPFDVQRSSGKKFWFKCKNGHSFYSSPNSISHSENSPYLGCKECRNGLVVGSNDLLSKEPNLLLYWDNKNTIKPDKVKYDPSGKNSNTLYWLHCNKGHLYQQSACKMIKSFVNGVKRCPVCSGQFLQEGVNDLATLNPEVAKYWDYDKNILKPSNVTPFSHKEAWFKCIKCGKSFCVTVNDRSKSIGYCNSCASNYNQSTAEREIISWLKGLGYKVKTDLVLGDHNYKYDIYLPDKKFVIEYNGVYFHSELTHPDRYYHYNKYKTCIEKGLQFIGIWEDDYKEKSDFIKKSILRKLGDSNERKVNARDCKVYNCTKLEAYNFLNHNHIQGFVDLSSYISLKDKKDTIVAVLAYSLNDGIMLIRRYATSCNVRGGFSKLLKYLEITIKPNEIVTFSDNAVSDGSLYSNLGFEKDKELPPDYSYVYHGGKRIHKFNLRKKDFEKDLNLYYDSDFTESELAEINNLYKIWDYGKIKWIKHI